MTAHAVPFRLASLDRLPTLVCVLLLAACRPAPPQVPVRLPDDLVRLGSERLAVAYADPRASDKQVLLRRINWDRAAAGVAPLAYDPRAALVGDLFCLDAAVAGSFGHWDLLGRPPYLRWTLAGGVDYHSQNAASYSVSSGRIDRTPASLLLETHEAMMAEQPPEDGHRRTILDPAFTHVGIGMALVAGEFRMTQEFTRAVFEWIEIPAQPLRPGEWATFSAQVPFGVEVPLVEVRHAPRPKPLSVRELASRGSYGYPPVVQTHHPRLPEGWVYEGGGRGDFSTERRRISVSFPLASGSGHYYVLAYTRPEGSQEAARPASAALVTAR